MTLIHDIRQRSCDRLLHITSSLSRHTNLLPFSFRLFEPAFRPAFQRSLTLLIRYRSWSTCLGLGVDPSNFILDYQPVLLASLPSSTRLPTRLSLFVVRRSSRLRLW